MRKSIKKVLALGIAAVMALSLAACGGGTSGSTQTDGADKGAAPDSAAADGGYSGKTLSIGIWGGNDQESAAINQVKADFEAKTGAKVEIKVIQIITRRFRRILSPARLRMHFILMRLCFRSTAGWGYWSLSIL